MTYLSLSLGPSYHIHEMTIFTCVDFLFKLRGAMIRDGAVIRLFTIYIYIYIYIYTHSHKIQDKSGIKKELYVCYCRQYPVFILMKK